MPFVFQYGCLKDNIVFYQKFFMIWYTNLIIFLSNKPPSYFIFSGLYIPFSILVRDEQSNWMRESYSGNFFLSPQVPRWHNLMVSQILFNFSSFQNWIQYNSFTGFIKWIAELYFCYCSVVKSCLTLCNPWAAAH